LAGFRTIFNVRTSNCAKSNNKAEVKKGIFWPLISSQQFMAQLLAVLCEHLLHVGLSKCTSVGSGAETSQTTVAPTCQVSPNISRMANISISKALYE
jgi:hypothetical protein